MWQSVTVFILSLNGRYKKKTCEPQVLPQTRQNYYRNLWDIETCLQRGNNGRNSNIWFSTFKIWVTSVTKAQHSECPSVSRTEENMSQIKTRFWKRMHNLLELGEWVGNLSWIMPQQFDTRSENAMNWWAKAESCENVRTLGKAGLPISDVLLFCNWSWRRLWKVQN